MSSINEEDVVVYCKGSFWLLFLFMMRSAVALTSKDCMWRFNISDFSTSGFTEKLEDCIYYFLLHRAKSIYKDPRLLYLDEPPTTSDDVFTITVSHVIVRRVELSWTDERLKWNEEEWQIDEYTLHDKHHIWKPTINEEYYSRECSEAQGCYSTVHEIDIFSSGRVVALYSFRYPAFCTVDYYKYPEEENDCCLLFSIGDFSRKVRFDMQVKGKIALSQIVKMKKLPNEPKNSAEEHSAWMMEHQTVGLTKMGGSDVEFLHICVHAKKEMSTLRIALRLPVTIATVLMLASPLIGHLNSQIYVKLFALSLQTISFLFLCSIAPESGFGKTKPKICKELVLYCISDTFFETVVLLTVISTMINMITIALSRVKRTFPPRHNFYLAAKVINRLICCIEPDPAASYIRQLDDDSQPNLDNTQPDYTVEWRHIYIAANNIFSAFALVIFIVFAAFDVL
ncbi:unnamed protein product [Thelazia callipaeda]|uniref:Neur_chan_LBD domain-containing protein n=1 Tax=Thelazia callipaeda TaxID=103827 RepID=A0A0N5D3F3_THECL|nr:unnamed protein product [Thelazia callipaeda]